MSLAQRTVALCAALVLAAACGSRPGESPSETDDSAKQSPTPPASATPEATATPATPSPVPAITPSAAQLEEIERIERLTAQVRELQPLADVREVFIRREDASAAFLSSLTDSDREQIAKLDPALRLLDLIDDDTSFLDEYGELAATQVAGFYEPTTGKLYVIVSGDGAEFTASDELTISHEYVHALQDQHFDLDRLDESGTDDATEAFLAVVEGDASLASFMYFQGHSPRSLLDLYDDPAVQEALEQADEISAALMAYFMFPYTEGLSFVTDIYYDGGWQAVDQLLREPPLSTEQIIHPEAFGANDAPSLLDDPRPAALAGDGWKFVEAGTAGELLLRVHLGTRLSEARAGEAADGWGGDRWTLWSKGEESVLVVATTWDNQGEADEFVDLYERFLIERYRDVEEMSNGSLTATDGQATAFIARVDVAVAVLVIGTDADAVRAAGRELAP